MLETVDTFDLTPDPKILLALTRTPMQPLDALCELIDNAIDSFHTARVVGAPVDYPLVAITLPSKAELSNGLGSVKVRDNGPGLTREDAEKAVRAGYSGNNPYDRLGLFGMGFNISTGKLGRVSKLVTATKNDDAAVEVTIDLEQIRQSRSYMVPFRRIPKPDGFGHGTEIDVSQWWPEGDPNSNFVRKLVQYGMPTIRAELGRRYATLLENHDVRIAVNGAACEAFKHCAWSDSRSVQRKGLGVVPAVYRLDQVIETQKRCTTCNSLVPPESSTCPYCGSAGLRTIEERVRGWVGIQRYDDPTEYGIDLIRNGRAIRISEKVAFFEYTDEFKHTVRDYPIDSPYGRIIGQVHLNHVPVDFLKQDFQRSSPEWQRAMSFLRGDSSLQPTQPNADKNSSYVYKLYQGYRRVRTPGKTDLYMGYWTPEGPKRISRDVEKDLRDRFAQKQPGYYDDAEWWKHVEAADKRPLEELVECPKCQAQNLKTQDTCTVCGFYLITKDCLNPKCGKKIPKSAQTCPICGHSQTPEIKTSWTCAVCGRHNGPNAETCSSCGEPRGTVNTLSREYLIGHSNKSDELSVKGCTVPLSDGTHSRPFDVDVYITHGQIVPNRQSSDHAVPLVAVKGDKLEVFLDRSHRVFTAFGVRPEQMIASELAIYLYDLNRHLASYTGLHTLANLEWIILRTGWGDRLEESPDRVREGIRGLFDDLRERLPELIDSEPSAFFEEMNKEEQTALLSALLDNGIDIGRLPELRATGEYLRYLDDAAVVNAFRRFPGLFLDGRYWRDPYEIMPELPESVIVEARERTRNTYRNCLEDIVGYLKYRTPDPVLTRRAQASVELLLQKVV